MLKPAITRSVCLVLLSLCPYAAKVSHANHLEPRHQQSDRTHNRDEWSAPLLSSYLGIGLGFGGDEVARFQDNFGYTDKVYGGGGLLLEAGLNLSVDQFTDLRLTGGYQFDGTSRGNGTSLFDRLRFDLTMLRRYGVHDFGVGVTAHTSVGYQCDINSICDGDVEFDHAIGYTLEYAIRAGLYRHSYGRGVRLGLRYTAIDYAPRLQDAELVNGDSLTGFVGMSF